MSSSQLRNGRADFDVADVYFVDLQREFAGHYCPVRSMFVQDLWLRSCLLAPSLGHGNRELSSFSSESCGPLLFDHLGVCLSARAPCNW